MRVYELVNNIKVEAMKLKLVSMACYGDITLYNNKKTIAYPYVNIEVLNNSITNNALGSYTLRIYIVDRNEPYICYNKCENIMDVLMKNLEIYDYVTNYITLNYQDLVNGIYVDVNYQTNLDVQTC